MEGSPALLVIDVQQAAFDGERLPPIFRADDLLTRTARLIAAAHAKDTPVIFLKHCGPKDQAFAEGTTRGEIHPSVAPEPVDAVVHKRQSSGFDGTELQRVLAEQGIDTVIACGLQSEFCVSNTAVAALELGLKVYVAQDAHSTWSTDDDEASVIIDRQNALLAERGATIEATDALVELLGTG
jgi:nicotinamidase-related amidase